MKILITGSQGLIGKSFRALYSNYEYNVLDYSRIDYDSSINKAFNVDLTTDDLSNAFSNVDVVIHLADLNPRSAEHITAFNYYNNNVNSTLNIIKNIEQNHIKHIIFISTSQIYGDGINFEENSMPNPLSTYAKSKLSCENIIKDFCNDNHVTYQILRAGSVAGAIIDKSITKSLCSEHHLISNIAKCSIKGTNATVLNPNILRTYIHIEDLCKAIDACINSNSSGIFNLGAYAASSHMIANEFRKQTGIECVLFKYENTELLHNTITCNLFNSTFGVEFSHNIDKMIKDSLTFYRKCK